ncbi:Protein of unknown function [Chitinophaga jiangningensis]|uniref:DUF2975 domain-containing protein n=1 Tax=Chitinophaga jiangningensis TaxID=1419482 RepID=A0A1M7L9S4_9BACT|nr:DUF2975 domain-containing protein [Chitinophaga jiangningensis]SHM74673.1 Protein of unknown function [Chitinophaga jiangningensis]
MNALTSSYTKTQQLLKVMYVFAWVVFIGLSINLGAVLVCFIVSLINPAIAPKLMDWTAMAALQQQDTLQYYSVGSLLIVFNFVKVFLSQIMIQILSGVNMQSPFTGKTVKLLEKMSYFFLSAAAIAYLYNTQLGYIRKDMNTSLNNISIEQFLILGGLVFILSQIFKRGVEIQTENDLTV